MAEGRESKALGIGRLITANYSINLLTTAKSGGNLLLALGTSLIVKGTVGDFWSAERLAKRQLIHSRCLTECSRCKAKIPETLQHMPGVERPQATSAVWPYLEAQAITGNLRHSEPDDMVKTLVLGGEFTEKSLESWNLNAS